ncbi:MAG TPA: hypothetical protein VM285_15120, partial [Polyangia bacterium]|nr:hypothetical protein [Polyangia bacterium]
MTSAFFMPDSLRLAASGRLAREMKFGATIGRTGVGPVVAQLGGLTEKVFRRHPAGRQRNVAEDILCKLSDRS